MSENNFIKEITSKDLNKSKNTILKMIKASSVKDFGELCKKSDFIFPYLKERISKDFVKLINKEDLKTVFEFSKIYSCDFEDLIVNSFLKFADEDLTDEILEIFEKGTIEQKAYCALYFSHIKDTLALEYLKNYAYSDFEPLKINCAHALSAFGDLEVYEDMKKIVQNSSDDFEKVSAFGFICAYKAKDSVDFILDNAFKSPFRVQIIANLLDFNDFEHLKNLEQNKIIQIFSALLEGYPEDISLDTLGFYNVFDFIKLIKSYNNQYAKNALILACEKFREFSENDIYSFDLDKNSKEDLKNIYNFLNNSAPEISAMEDELKLYNSHRFELALSVIKELNLKEYAKLIVSALDFSNEEYIAKIVSVLKEMNLTELISPSLPDKIQNENIKALVESYLK